MTDSLVASLERLRAAREASGAATGEGVDCSAPAPAATPAALRPSDLVVAAEGAANADLVGGPGGAESASAAPMSRVAARRARALDSGTRAATDFAAPASAGADLVAAAHGQPPSLAPGRPRIALRPRAALAGVLALLAIGGGVATGRLISTTASPLPVHVVGAAGAAEIGAAATAPVEGTAEAADSVDPPGGVLVHVAGQVHDPGVVELPDGARVAQAVEAAGGATAEAELAAVNLARVVLDGEQIIIPAIGEAPVAAATAPSLADAADSSGLINVNQAGSALLEQLPGIGPVLAERIVAYREQAGGFQSVEQLQEVSGIGPSVMSNIRSRVTV